jgi:hypothetical protein
MNTKMNETATMMKMPPKVMNPTASRSRSFTRRRRAAWYFTRWRMSSCGALGAAAILVSPLLVGEDAEAARGRPRTSRYSSLASSCFTMSAGSGR